MLMNIKNLIKAIIFIKIFSILIYPTFATIIWTGTVTGSGGLTTSIIWNNTFPGSAYGTINGIVVTARILPVLNMVISGSGIIDLGDMSSTKIWSWSVDIEIGTNANNGASVTARSQWGWMANLTNSAIKINNSNTDGFIDSYRFVTSILASSDSTAPWFVQSGSLDMEINSTTAVTIYSSNKPQNLVWLDDFRFSILAQPNIQTPAWDYTDKIILTVTWNF